MVKTLYNWLHPWDRDIVEVPDPPALPKYDPKDEAPKWSWERMWSVITPEEGAEDWPRPGFVPKEDDKPDWRGVVRNNIVPMPDQEPYRYGLQQDPRYYWFDTPDYADPFKKLWWSTRFFLASGLMAQSVLGLLFGYKFNLADNLTLARKTTIPWFIAGMSGSVIVITVANLRGKKDDLWNYFVGGAGAACVLGRKNHYTWWKSTLVYLPSALAVKHINESNLYIMTLPRRRVRSTSMSGQSGEDGFWSGDLRWGYKKPELGRGTRVIA